MRERDPDNYPRTNFLYLDASTSGWQTLAMQLQHPDFFGGAWVLQPDPIDFRHYQLTNIYEDSNAFEIPNGQFTSMKGHSWHSFTWAQMVRTMAEAVKRGAPKGEATGGWEY